MSLFGRELDRKANELHSSGSELERKYWWALGLYAGLGVLSWFTLGEGVIFVEGRPVELRLLPVIVLGGFALRTVIARHADRIRRGRDEDGGSTR